MVLTPCNGIKTTRQVAHGMSHLRQITNQVKFWKNLEVVPSGKGLEAFGASEELPPSLGAAIAATTIKDGDSIESIAQQSPETAVDLLWDFAISAAQSEDDFRELARAYQVGQKKLAEDKGRQWLSKTNAADFADDVFQQVRPKPTAETFGGTSLFSMLQEAGKRLTLKVPDAVSGFAVGLARKPLTRRIATFMGDAFQYLAERGDGTKPGPIASKVLGDIQEAATQAKTTGEPLVVICHSFGGEIAYDIFTHYSNGTELQVDVWVTVGSQVGLFEEMSLLWNSPGRLSPVTAIGNEALAAPGCVKRWINIVDANDVLGFLVLPVFTGKTVPGREPNVVLDFNYDTGYAVTGAHSGYFEWPSFYKRLAHRLS